METMRRVFRWVIGAKRSLRLDELEEAVGIAPEDDCYPVNRIPRGAGEKLVSDCGNLVMHDTDDNTVRFAHHSVQQYLCEYLNAQHVSFNSGDFDISSTDEYIGEVCLAYLSFSDFETQIVKMPEQMKIDREKVEYLLWWMVPFAPILKGVTLLTRRSKSTPRQNTPHQVPLILPTFVEPSTSLTCNFVLLEYIVANWPFHTFYFTKKSSVWPSFRHTAIEKELLFDFRPWNERRHVAKVDKFLNECRMQQKVVLNDVWRRNNMPTILMYSWAIGHGVPSLLNLIDAGSLRPYVQLATNEKNPTRQRASGKILAFQIYFNIVARARPKARPSSSGLWHAAVLARANALVCEDKEEVLAWCREEHERWGDTVTPFPDVA